MTAALDVNDSLLVNFRTHIVVMLRHYRKSSKHIYLSDSLCRLLDTHHFLCDRIPDVAEHIILQSKQTVLRSQDHIFQLL